MSLIVKIMSDQDLPDHDPCKEFKLVIVPNGSSIHFHRNPTNEPIVVVATPATRQTEYHHEIYPQPGNAYVLNEQGKTIAVRNSKSEIVPIPKNAKEALKLGRGGKRAVPGVPEELATLQNMAAASATTSDVKQEYVFSPRCPANAVEAFHFGRLGQIAPKGTLETLAIIQNHTAVEALKNMVFPVTSGITGNKPQAGPTNPNVPYPTASLATGPKDNTQRGIRKD